MGTLGRQWKFMSPLLLSWMVQGASHWPNWHVWAVCTIVSLFLFYRYKSVLSDSKISYSVVFSPSSLILVKIKSLWGFLNFFFLENIATKKFKQSQELHLLLVLGSCLSITKMEFVRQKKNKYMFLLKTECSTFHSTSIMTLRGS